MTLSSWKTLCSLASRTPHHPEFPATQRKHWPILLCPFGFSSTSRPLNVGGSLDSVLGPLASFSIHSLGNHIQPYDYKYHLVANTSQMHASSPMTSQFGFQAMSPLRCLMGISKSRCQNQTYALRLQNAPALA